VGVKADADGLPSPRRRRPPVLSGELPKLVGEGETGLTQACL